MDVSIMTSGRHIYSSASRAINRYPSITGISLFPPQYHTLLDLSRLTLTDLRSYISGQKSRSGTDLLPLLPEVVRLPMNQIGMALPGDPLHSSAKDRDVEPNDRHRIVFKKERGRFSDIRVVRRGPGFQEAEEEVGELQGKL